MPSVAALYVDPKGIYSTFPDVDCWDEERDARKYEGPYPVIAHPPCSRWCQLAPLNEARYGHKVGDDGGCFESALEAVRKHGGILEHPAFSKAWGAYGLNWPPTGAEGWVKADEVGWTAYVEQGRYGHPARKATWLYAVSDAHLPALEWGASPARTYKAVVSWCYNHGVGRDRPRVGKKQAAATPPVFAEILLDIARHA